MLSAEQARELWANSEEIVSEDAVRGSLDRMAEEITEKIGDTFPMVLSVMGGAAVFTGMLLPKLAFPLEFDYIHLSRYNNKTVGGEMQWRVAPRESVKGRTVLVLDPMLATANSAVAAVERLKSRGAKDLRFVCLLAAPEGIARFQAAHPDVPVWTAAIDSHLNDHGYIVPGLGDAGDRMYGTR